MRFKYGNYEFKRNPSSKSNSVTYVGDNPITLSGRVITQPSFYKQQISLEALFWQPGDKKLEVYYINDNVLCYNNNKFYGYSLSEKQINIYNMNMIIENVIDLENYNFSDVHGITVMNDYIYLNVTNLIGENYLYKINKYSYDTIFTLLVNSDPIVQAIYPSFVSKGLTNDGTCLYYLNDINQIIRYDINAQSGQIIATIGSIVGIYDGLEYVDGYYYTVENIGGKKFLYKITSDNWKITDGADLGNDDVNYICLSDHNNLYYIGNGTCTKMYLNSTIIDINKLITQARSGMLTLTDHYGRKYRCITNSLNYKRAEKLKKSYDVSLTIEGVL